MRTVTFCILFFMILASSLAQVGIGTTTPNPSALLDMTSTSKGLLPPRLTISQIWAISSPATGLMVYCTNCNCGRGSMQIYERECWHELGSSAVLQTACGTTSEYYPVCAANLTWLDRNLGSSRVATSPTDFNAYGYRYQWGRANDDHQCATWTSSTAGTYTNGTTSTRCSGGTCPDGLFVTRIAPPWNWNSDVTPNQTLWNGTIKGINDPCPSGYRVPSGTEMAALVSSFATNDVAGAYGSPAKLTAGGYRSSYDGTNMNVSTDGYYWSSTYNSINGIFMTIYGETGDLFVGDDAVEGFAVRCIAQ
jgi:uncharacterized protein (TIGR02145 family)